MLSCFTLNFHVNPGACAKREPSYRPECLRVHRKLGRIGAAGEDTKIARTVTELDSRNTRETLREKIQRHQPLTVVVPDRVLQENRPIVKRNESAAGSEPLL